MNGKPVDAERKTSLKKLYQQPTLRMYGSIQDITRTGIGNPGTATDVRGGMTDTRTH